MTDTTTTAKLSEALAELRYASRATHKALDALDEAGNPPDVIRDVLRAMTSCTDAMTKLQRGIEEAGGTAALWAELPTVSAGEVIPGDLLYIAADCITVGAVAGRRATRKSPTPRIAIYAERGGVVDDRNAAVVWPVTKEVRLDPRSPRYQAEEQDDAS
jgi:hypothetical protein